jgi:hypothetical protein
MHEQYYLYGIQSKLFIILKISGGGKTGLAMPGATILLVLSTGGRTGLTILELDGVTTLLVFASSNEGNIGSPVFESDGTTTILEVSVGGSTRL